MTQTDFPVSYVVTIYNKARYLPGVLEAIATEHAGTGGEIILVDDGSTDESPALLSRFVANHPEARVLTQPNRGVAAATNAGLAAAACPYIRLIDADDTIAPGSTRRLIAALRETGCGFGYGAMETRPLPVGEAAAGKDINIIHDPLYLMLRRQPFIPSMTLGTREAMRSVLPLPEDIRTAQDFSLGVRLAVVTKFVAIAYVCCIVPAQSGGLSASKARMFCDTLLLSLRLADEMGWKPGYRRLSLGRSAGRARNYLRRHAPHHHMAIVAASAIALLARVPLPWPYAGLMSYIVGIYRKVLSETDQAP